jgi:transposase InsO family protein
MRTGGFTMRKTTSLPYDNALWRYGIISPLLNRSIDEGTLHATIQELAQRQFLKSNGIEISLSPETIRAWYYRYKRNGIDGLRNKQRITHGSTSLPQELQKDIQIFRSTYPQWTSARILQELKKQGKWNGHKPSRNSFYRYIASRKLGRQVSISKTPVRMFEYHHFGDLWSADFLHGPKVRAGTHVRKAYLHAIIDDATRYILIGHFHLAEDTRALLTDFMVAIRRFGIPKRLYTDNGAAFRSRHLKIVAAKLGIALPHTPPYMPKGRGKIERFFRNVRDNFLSGREKSSLEKLNNDFGEWVTLYNQTPHRSLKMSPLNRKLIDLGDELKQLPVTTIDDIFCIEEQKKIGADGCIRIFNKRFEVPDALPGTMTMIYYLPWETTYIRAGENKTRLKMLNAHNNALRFDKPTRKNEKQGKDNS